ncbi:Transglutaminase-like superfamily protein [Spirosomataceae bacterium TFI 002]|nr:Transglutaminase-like superfamily protein [Spirosomataceae bacterium TFI 002]
MKALVSLLDDSDEEVYAHVEERIKGLGDSIIPVLESHWEENSLNVTLQRKIELLIHEMQYGQFTNGLIKWKENGAQDILEGMWLVAKYQYPDLEFEKVKAEINQIYFDAWLLLRDEVHPHDAIKILNHIFFEKYGFTGNTKNFHSPANSMINQVVDVKKGNPISLCVIYMIVAQRLNLPVFGVNLPSLFILTYESPTVQFYINVFNKGLIFSKNDIDTYLKQMKVEPRKEFYKPCTNLEIIKRVLLNLIVSFKKNSDIEKVKEINFIFDKM